MKEIQLWYQIRKYIFECEIFLVAYLKGECFFFFRAFFFYVALKRIKLLCDCLFHDKLEVVICIGKDGSHILTRHGISYSSKLNMIIRLIFCLSSSRRIVKIKIITKFSVWGSSIIKFAQYSQNVSMRKELIVISDT